MNKSATYHGGGAMRSGFSGAGGSAFTRANILEGQAVDLDTKGATDVEVLSGVAGFRDDFTDAALKPFWQNLPVITSGDWVFNAGADTLDGAAAVNPQDAFREGIEGDLDYSMLVDFTASVSVGFYLDGNGITAQLQAFGGNINFLFSGQPPFSVAEAATVLWLRIVRRGTDFLAYYKVNATDQWTLVGNHSGFNMGHSVVASLDSDANAIIHEFLMWDSQFPQRNRSTAPKSVLLTDAATIVVDASRGNNMEVTLGGNRTLGAPTNPQAGQLILFRVRQDGTGSRTLAYNAIYRFFTDLPSPTLSTAVSAIDLLGFVYDAVDNRWDFIAKVFGG